MKKHGHCADCGFPPLPSRAYHVRALSGKEKRGPAAGGERREGLFRPRAPGPAVSCMRRGRRRRHFAAAAVFTEKATGIRLIALHQRQDWADLRDFSAQRGGASLLIVSTRRCAAGNHHRGETARCGDRSQHRCGEWEKGPGWLASPNNTTSYLHFTSQSSQTVRSSLGQRDPRWWPCQERRDGWMGGEWNDRAH